MNDMPSSEQEQTQEPSQDDNPVFQAIKAMARLKEKNEVFKRVIDNQSIVLNALRIRVENLENGFEIACKESPGPLRDYFDSLKKDNEGTNESEESSESDESEESEESSEPEESSEEASDSNTVN